MATRILRLALLFVAATLAQEPAGLPAGETWLQHLTRDLLPFWSMPAALGTAPGEFPSTRCDDGSAVDFAAPCAEVSGSAYLRTPARYLVPMSRQTYGYGVAFHLTGDPRYLDWMRQGVASLRRNWIDPAGGMFTTLDLRTGAWGPARASRNPQELAYGLLGLGFYYYLTRDEAVLPDLLASKRYIFENYYNGSIGAMQWTLASTEKRLVADLDQMNAYMVLLAPLLPEPHRSEWLRDLRLLAHSILWTFYSPRHNLVFLSADAPRDRDLALTGTDFGHSIKSMWMIWMTGLLTGDQGLASFAARNGQRLLERAFLPSDGSWAQGMLAGGGIDRTKNWWIYSELDQFAGSVALADRAAARFLPLTTDYWLRNFVDHQYGEVWNAVADGTNAPIRNFPKAWQWKSAYHSFEHALVGYLTSRWMHSQTATLHFAFTIEVRREDIRPYFFTAPVESLTSTGGIQTVTFGAPPAPAAPPMAVVSAASFLPGPLGPGSIASAFGAQLEGTVSVRDATGVTRPAQVFYASPLQVNFLIPPETPPGQATVLIGPAATQVTIAAVAPGVFQSEGWLAATIQRGSTYEPLTLAGVSPGEDVYLALYATGIRNARQVQATLGGQNLPVLYTGPQGGFIGLDQVNIGPLPRSLAARGALSLVVTADGQTANPVELVMR